MFEYEKFEYEKFHCDKFEYENFLKDNYHEAYENSKDAYGQKFTIAQIRALKEMANNDVWPDGTFGDDECILWSLLREGRES